MHATRLRLLIIALLLSGPTVGPPAGLAEPLVVDRIAAVVNGDVITLSEVQEAVLQQTTGRLTVTAEPVSEDFAGTALTPRALLRQLRLLINRRLELQEAKRLGIATSDTELRQALDDIMRRNGFASDADLDQALAAEGLTLALYREQLRSELAVAKLVNREVRSRAIVSPDDVRRFYDEHREEFLLPTRVRLRQIFFAGPVDQPALREQRRALARTTLDALRQGAEFALQARRLSNGPEAADGGDLGWFEPGTLTPELDQVAFSLPVGDVSEVIETAAGWHILTVEAQEGRRERPFDGIEEALRQRLIDEKSKQLHEVWFLELREKAYVDIRL